MTQEAIPERDLIETWWSTYGGDRWQIMSQEELNLKRRNDVANWRLKNDPWSNGRYAIAALAWGLIVMVVLSVAP